MAFLAGTRGPPAPSGRATVPTRLRCKYFCTGGTSICEPHVADGSGRSTAGLMTSLVLGEDNRCATQVAAKTRFTRNSLLSRVRATLFHHDALFVPDSTHFLDPESLAFRRSLHIGYKGRRRVGSGGLVMESCRRSASGRLPLRAALAVSCLIAALRMTRVTAVCYTKEPHLAPYTLPVTSSPCFH